MVQGKRTNSKPKFAEVEIGDNEAKEMREEVLTSASSNTCRASLEKLQAMGCKCNPGFAQRHQYL